jgi:hypothetical protein
MDRRRATRRGLLGRLGSAAACTAAGLAGCTELGSQRRRETDPDGETASDRRRSSPSVPPDATFGYTHVAPTGNRYATGTAGLPTGTETARHDVSVSAEPVWLAGGPAPGDGGRRPTRWVAVLADGRVRGFTADADGVEPVAVTGVEGSAADTGPANPPLLALTDADARLVTAPEAGRFGHPVPVGDALLTVTTDGRLVVDRSGSREPLSAVPLPDARIVTRDGLGYVLTEPTDRYRHGALGDTTEAGGLVAVEPDRGVVADYPLPGESVVEGVAPILGDLLGEGPTPLVTLSDERGGSRLALLGTEGAVAEGPPIGRGNRWRHQLAVAPFGPDGGAEIAAVRTPHVGGTVECYRRRGDALELVARRNGYSSHEYGSRILDGAVAGDLDDDGRVELLVPTDARDELACLRRVGDEADTDGNGADSGAGLAEPWRLPVGGRLTTNVAVAGTAVDRVGRPAGRLTLCVGHPGGLRFWTPT